MLKLEPIFVSIKVWLVNSNDIGTVTSFYTTRETNETVACRNLKQIYVWANKRSPYQNVLEGFSVKGMDNVFNMTMTFR